MAIYTKDNKICKVIKPYGGVIIGNVLNTDKFINTGLVHYEILSYSKLINRNEIRYYNKNWEYHRQTCCY